ncbi:hypothetical protein [Rhodococcus sp. ARC_M6]|uniref:hypothetical protein n=1 Tax=Rhodococcus sp. ARC_M6 TaxID=2928852 RepID=UPI001FB4E45E|nr:hypothetical protein [Rhodococcus sp. ARC_M6]MCJ0907075.1 hypothetical protein [Rhodococcus sp. ARC_M6]
MTNPPTPNTHSEQNRVVTANGTEQHVDVVDAHMLTGRVRDAVREVPVGGPPVAAGDAAQKPGRSRRVGALFPWMRHLPDGDGAQFVDELAGALESGPAEMMLVVETWRRTAEVWATPEVAEVLSAPSDGDFGVVEDVALEAGYAALAADQVESVNEQRARRSRYIDSVDMAHGE